MAAAQAQLAVGAAARADRHQLAMREFGEAPAVADARLLAASHAGSARRAGIVPATAPGDARRSVRVVQCDARHALAEHIVFAPTAISDVGFDPATQSVHALLTDADGECILLTRSWESAAAGALDALARALTASAPVRHVTGVLREFIGGGGFEY